jgi:hypothetical protein
MDLTKLDPGLLAELTGRGGGEDLLRVFVRTRSIPTGGEAEALAAAGVPVTGRARTVFTATLPAAGVRALADLPVVQHLSLSRRLHPLSTSSP